MISKNNIVKLFNKIGFILVRDWADIGHKNTYTFERIVSKCEFKEKVYGCTVHPNKFIWYYYDESGIDSISRNCNFEEVFEFLSEKERKVIIYNLDFFI